jgi:5'-AMP-activated protein kinase regulatory beta subunit
MADADCGMGKICEAASCQAAQCAVDADCGATQSCAKQRCATPSCTPPAVPISLGSAPGALTVGLIGTFNSWSTGAASAAPWLLTQNGDKWSGSFTLSPGANSYKFFVESATICMPEVDAGTSGTCDPSETCLNGHCWSYVPDPANIHTASDGFGGLNAIITMSCTGIVPYTPPAGGEGGTGGASGGCAPPPIAFTYTDGQATTVSVYGSFDMWSVAAAKPLAKGAAGVWSTTINLAPDTYQYKFIVDTTKYLADPANSNSVSDGFGHTNSVLTVACSGVIAAGGSGGTAGSGAAAGSANGSAGHAGNGGAH